MNKKNLGILALVLAMSVTFLVSFKALDNQKAEAEWLQITTIESVVPGGLGRSRMITRDHKGEMEETKMKNFFSLVGINFNNVRQNDQQITDKLAQLTAEGWELVQITPGVYSASDTDAGGTGIFITRYLFKK